jgi:hypothetical protein
MKCPLEGCSGRLRVLESRERRGRVHRRHLCDACGHRCQSIQELTTPQQLDELRWKSAQGPVTPGRPRPELPEGEAVRFGILLDLASGAPTADIMRRYGVTPTQIAALQYAFKTAQPPPVLED